MNIILNKLNLNPIDYIEFIAERPGHDFAYHLSSKKIQKELNWKQQISFEDGITNLI
jgi:dTDP-glucose 4,6-dehydratase